MNTFFTVVLIIVALVLFVDWRNGWKLFNAIFNRGRNAGLQAAQAARSSVADANLAIEDSKAKVQEMKSLRVRVITQRNLATTKVAKQKGEVEKFENLAKQAGAAGNVDDVKLALEKKGAAETALRFAEKEFTMLDNQENQLEAQINEVEGKLTHAESNKNFLTSKLEINNFQKDIARSIGDGGNILSSLGQLELDANAAEAETEAYGEVSASGRSLEDKYSKGGVTEADVAAYLTKPTAA